MPRRGVRSATVTNVSAHAIGRTAIIQTSHAIQTIIAGGFEGEILTHEYNDQRKIGIGGKRRAEEQNALGTLTLLSPTYVNKE